MSRLLLPTAAALAVGLATLDGPVVAQRPAYAELIRIEFLEDSDASYAVASLDFDGDGAADLFFGNDGGGDRLYRNTGRGEFVDVTATHLPPSNGAPARVVVAGDFNGDGLVDLFVARTAPLGRNNLLLNIGGRRFANASARLPNTNDPTTAAAAGDVDGDGDLDLVYVNGAGPDVLLLNDGTATFSAAPAGRYPTIDTPAESVLLVDVDADGDLDVVTGLVKTAASPRDALYLNDGSGSFLDVSATQLPGFGATTSAVAAGDFDRDGDVDLFMGQALGVDSILWNDGSGTFTVAAPTTLPAELTFAGAAAAFDVDADGDLDLLVGVARAGGFGNPLYLNDGSGRFSRSASHSASTAVTRDVAVFDANADGFPDLVEANVGQQNRLFLNDGLGRLRDTISRAPIEAYRPNQGLAAADFDGDGYTDVVVVGTEGRNLLMLNDGGGFFRDGSLPPATTGTLWLAPGDADGDGDIDLYVANRGRDALWWNDGTGSFQAAAANSLPNLAETTLHAVFADVDGDGDQDVVTAGFQSQNRLLLNDGTGRFTDASSSHMPADQLQSRFVMALDIDSDGDPDLLFGNRRQSTVYLNDGLGRFADATAGRFPAQGVLSYETANIAAGDVDGDGDVDLLFGDENYTDRLFLNDGTAHFVDATATNVRAGREGIRGVQLADVDSDGDLDALRGGRAVWLNDGTGVFTDAAADVLPELGDHVLAEDFDRDGDLDILSDTGLLTGLQLQLTSDDDARIGLPYTLRAISRHGSAAQVVPVVGARRASLTLPGLGVLGLDPNASLVALPGIVLSTPGGEGTLTLTIPDSAALLGVDLPIQALHVGQPTVLTNLLVDRVRP